LNDASPIRIISMHHVQIAFPPRLEAEMLAFFGGLLRLTPINKPASTGDARGAWFDAGNIQLHLGAQPEGFTPARKAHVGLVVENLEAAAATLQAAGRPVTFGSDLPGFRRLFSEDPAGNRLEFLQAQP
jgi:catechol 2,3-dioxygenase-like lactoylglutathione lyase family enzyme